MRTHSISSSIHLIALLHLAWMLSPGKLAAQFAPAAGKPGSTAIKADSNCIIDWASGCQLVRGLRQINLPDSGYADVGKASNAVGRALSNGVVSLGDGGVAVLTFDSPIADEQGYDFVVFENGFNDTFLELATVEISTDSINWAMLPSESLTQTLRQTAPFGGTKATEINNLAGKYRLPYGTPFDIAEMGWAFSVNPFDIRYVRITDVVGSIDTLWGRKDSKGNMINDPFPTNFGSSGFDLDAVGVIHQMPKANTPKFSANNGLTVRYHQQQIWINGLPPHCQDGKMQLVDASGKSYMLTMKMMTGNRCVIPCELSAGWYQIQFLSSNGQRLSTAFIAQP